MYQIVIEDEKSLMTVTYEGSVNVGERSVALDEAIVVIDARHLTRVLLDFTEAHFVLDDFDASKALAKKLAISAAQRSCQVAYLSHPGAQINKVVETLSTAKGFDFQRFDDRSAALQWLLGI